MSDDLACPKCGRALIPAPDHGFTRTTGEPISVCAVCDWPVRTSPPQKSDRSYTFHRLPCRGGPFDGSMMQVMIRESDSTVDIPDDPRGRQWRYLVERDAGTAVYLQFVGPV